MSCVIFDSSSQYLTQSISKKTGYQSRPVWTSQPLQSCLVFQQSRRVSTSQGSDILFSSIFSFLKNISVNSYLNVLTFKVTIINNSSVCNNFYVEESEPSRRELSITFILMKTGTTHVNEETEKVSSVNLSLNAEPSYSKNSQDEDLINSTSALINTRSACVFRRQGLLLWRFWDK